MTPTKSSLNRRRFIHNVAGLVVSSAIIPDNLFANTFQKDLNICSAGIDLAKINCIKNSLSKLNQSFLVNSPFQKADLFFVSKASIKAIESQINDHSLIIIDSDFDSINFQELINFCNKNGIHLAKIEKWSDKINSSVLFDKITFIETNVNQNNINQSICYLNILSKLTINTGLIIA